jgi:CDP-4-dehydro-6-deoxyglucose reductase, E3
MTHSTAPTAQFQINVQPSNRTFSAAGDIAILQAAINAGIGLPYGCRDGACGSCKCKLVSGEITQGLHQLKALSEAEKAQGYILTCCAFVRTDVVLENKQVSAEGSFPVTKMPARVVSMERAAPDVMVIKLQLPAANKLQYHAGQYIEFILRDGARRSYSMGNAPEASVGDASGQVELHLRHMPGGKFTDHVFNAMKEKEILRVEGPLGSFYLREYTEKPIVFVASGTGFAPIKAIIEHMQAKAITRPATLYWGGRRPHDLYMHQWCVDMAAKLPHLTYIPVISDALLEDAWTGRTGFVHRAVMQDFSDLSAHEVYACGAPIVVDSAKRDFMAQCKLPEEAFFADSFTTEADKHGAAA